LAATAASSSQALGQQLQKISQQMGLQHMKQKEMYRH